MTLSALIRKRDTGNLATAIPAISATQPKGEARTVARIATVAVANPKEGQAAPPVIVGDGDTVAAPMTADDEKAIRAWLALIEETAPAIIADVLNKCRTDAEALDYFTGRAVAELPKSDPFPDDRRSCTQCTNLRQGVCSVATPEVGALVVANRGYRPVPLPLRCAGYQPKPSDTG